MATENSPNVQHLPSVTINDKHHLHVPVVPPRISKTGLRLHNEPTSNSVSKENLSVKDTISSESSPRVSFDSLNNEYREPEFPSVGLQIPLLRIAGDAQAPAPNLRLDLSSQSEDDDPGSASDSLTAAKRKKSSVNIPFITPPGSYGLHGHGVAPTSKMEMDWYKKHPEDLAKELEVEHRPAAAGELRREWNLSSVELNKLVEDTARTGCGVGTSENATSLPDEESAQYVVENLASIASSASIYSSDVDLPVYRNSSDSEDNRNIKNLVLGSIITKPISPGSCQKPAVRPRQASDFGQVVTDYFGDTDELRDKPGKSAVEESVVYEPLFHEDADQKSPSHCKSQESDPGNGSFPRRTPKFPSKDIWEDTPEICYLETVVTNKNDDVETPVQGKNKPTKNEVDLRSERVTSNPEILPEHLERLSQAKPFKIDEDGNFTLGDSTTTGRAAIRAQDGLNRRDGYGVKFPSKDIWEDTAENLQLTTTVSIPDTVSPVDTAKKSLAKPVKPSGLTPDNQEKIKPKVPARPSIIKSASLNIGGRSSPITKSMSGNNSVSSTASATSLSSATIRPVGSKIASLNAKFLNDLNDRLQSGLNIHRKDPTPAQRSPPLVSPTVSAPKSTSASQSNETSLLATKLDDPATVPISKLSDTRRNRVRGPKRRTTLPMTVDTVPVETSDKSVSLIPVDSGIDCNVINDQSTSSQCDISCESSSIQPENQ